MNYYSDKYEELIHYDEIGVVLSLIEDKELVRLREALTYIGEKGAFQLPNFPLSLAGLNYLVCCVSYELARRVGKGIRVEGGRAVVCEREESPFVRLDWREQAPP